MTVLHSAGRLWLVLEMSRFIKIAVCLTGGLVGLGAIAALGAYLTSNSRLATTYAVTPRAVVIPADAASLARGKHIAETRGCNDCHGKDYAGNKVIEDGAMGVLHGPNLTRGKGSRVAGFKDEDWVRAIRHGVGPDQRGLYIMPSAEYASFSDEDLGAVIAFIKSVPPVDRERVPTSFGPVARVLLAVGKIKLDAGTIDHAKVQPKTVAIGATADYGRYLAVGCTGCHGQNFSGGKIDVGPPDWPHAANLTPHADGRLAKWTEEEFIRSLRTAKRPDGTELNPVMPRLFGQMDNVELKAIWAYFKTLPPVATGVR